MTADDKPNIVLTGFMGTGKTTTGRVLADLLDMDFIDTDEIIEGRHGAISALFADRGEASFRALERELAHELSDRTNTVISTGGRMLLDSENAMAMSRRAQVFCLVAAPEEILDRVRGHRGEIDRPLLASSDPLSRIVELLDERDDGYGQFRQIVTTGRSPRSVAREIAALVQS